MFLIRHAKDVMENYSLLADANIRLESLNVQADRAGGIRHVVVTDEARILGGLLVDNALQRVAETAGSSVTLRDIVSRKFAVVRENDIVFDVIQRICRKDAEVALVVRGGGVPHAQDIAGIITKEHIADSVASSIKVYPS